MKHKKIVCTCLFFESLFNLFFFPYCEECAFPLCCYYCLILSLLLLSVVVDLLLRDTVFRTTGRGTNSVNQCEIGFAQNQVLSTKGRIVFKNALVVAASAVI